MRLSNDLHHAKIYVSVYGEQEHKQQVMEVLSRASSFVRREIGRRLSLRYAPEIIFKFDTSIEYGDHINRLLAQVKAKEQEHEGK